MPHVMHMNFPYWASEWHKKNGENPSKIKPLWIGPCLQDWRYKALAPSAISFAKPCSTGSKSFGPGMLATLPLGNFGLWAQEVKGECLAHVIQYCFFFSIKRLVSPKHPSSHAATLQAGMHSFWTSINRGGHNHHISFAAASTVGKHRRCFVDLLNLLKFIEHPKTYTYMKLFWVEKHHCKILPAAAGNPTSQLHQATCSAHGGPQK